MRQHQLVFLTLLLCAGSLWAGEQLSSNELVQRSLAIADVSIQWDNTHKASPKITLHPWIKAPEQKTLASLKTSPEYLQKWIGLCLPDATLLQHWLSTYPHFEKSNRDLWQNALEQKTYRSILFLRTHPATGLLQPTCETEALLAQGWSAHTGFTGYLKRIKAEVLKLPPKIKKKTAHRLPPATQQTESPANKSLTKQGCGCRSSH